MLLPQMLPLMLSSSSSLDFRTELMCDFKGEIKIFQSDLRSYSCHKMIASISFSCEKNNCYMHTSSTSLNGPHSCTQLYTPPISTNSPVLSDEALPQAKLAEDVHHNFHGRVHSHREGAEVQDAAQFDCRNSVE